MTANAEYQPQAEDAVPWAEWRTSAPRSRQDIQRHAAEVEGTQYDIPDSADFLEDGIIILCVGTMSHPVLASAVLNALDVDEFLAIPDARLISMDLSPVTTVRLHAFAAKCEGDLDLIPARFAFTHELFRRGECEESAFIAVLSDAHECSGFSLNFILMLTKSVQYNIGWPASKYDLRGNPVVADLMERYLRFSEKWVLPPGEFHRALNVWFEDDSRRLELHIRAIIARRAKVSPDAVKIGVGECACGSCMQSMAVVSGGITAVTEFIDGIGDGVGAAWATRMLLGFDDLGVEIEKFLLSRIGDNDRVPLRIARRYGLPVPPPIYIQPRAAHSANFATETDTIL